MDGHAGYNQIFIAEEDVHKTAFRCPGAIITYEWVVMPFGLNHAGATYQRAMNLIFHDLIGRTVEVYIDDVVVKSPSRADHVGHLRQAFDRMRAYGLKMNPTKCAFGVTAGNFLGFLVHQRGIEVDKNKAKAIMAAPPPRTKKELQSFLGKAEYEALIIGLEILKEMKATRVLVYGSVLFDLSKRAVSKGIGRLIAPVSQRQRHQGYHDRISRGDLRRSQSGVKMRWLVRRHGYYWRTILKDCIEYVKGCIKCQIYGPIQRVLAEALHPVTKPWPFRGWAVDIISKIYSAASNQHAWILVATDYFTKWVEAESYRSISSAQVVKFFEKHIVHRFGIPETITADNGPVFPSAETREYTEKMGIKLVHSTPYYPKSNGQAEVSNKVIKGILEKMIEEKPRAWHDLLPEALWAYRVSKRSATGTSPYALTYGHDAIVPMELKVRSLRVNEQPGEERNDYAQAMAQESEDLEQSRLDAYNLMQAQKQIAARACNRKVKQKTFAKGDLVWRAVLPIGTKDPRFGKFSPNWEGPFIIERILGRGAFQLRDRDGEWHNLPINGQYLKKYNPSLWETAENGLCGFANGEWHNLPINGQYLKKYTPSLWEMAENGL
ncbi:uncharacterized protein K02A2.6-like [Prunus avium]|uniref:Uncharacterized protein K02A2.6-like n=1 Tax=Prunus avium TaxID=42229 RepID=A0A6P5T5X9_PRUAV|nr:uncharacterized protein K02A2.6-like [Prunus avium]